MQLNPKKNKQIVRIKTQKGIENPRSGGKAPDLTPLAKSF